MKGYRAPPLTVLQSPVGRPSETFGAHSPPPFERAETHRRRDPNVSRMTAFPVPGYAASPTHSQIPPQLQDAARMAREFVDAPKTTGRMSDRQPATSSVRVKDPPRSATMYWMPDNVCKTCYDCGASFTIFRRRHHCRLCGQIFCHSCSSQFVDGSMHGFPDQMIRICKFCSKYVTADAERKLAATAIAMSELTRRTSMENASRMSTPSATFVGTFASSVSLPSAPSPLLFSPVNVKADSFRQFSGEVQLERLSDEYDEAVHGAMLDDELPRPPCDAIPPPLHGKTPPPLHEKLPSQRDELPPPVADKTHPTLHQKLPSQHDELPPPPRDELSPPLNNKTPPPLHEKLPSPREEISPPPRDELSLPLNDKTLPPLHEKLPSPRDEISPQHDDVPLPQQSQEVPPPLHDELPPPRDELPLPPRDELPPPPQTEELPPPPPLYTIESSESMDFVQFDPAAPALPPKPTRRPSLARRRRSTLEFIDSIELSTPTVTGSTTSESKPKLLKRPSFAEESSSFRVKTDDVTQREIVLDKYMKAAHERIREGIQHSVDRVMKHFAGDGIEVKRLVASVEDMAFIVTGHLLFSMNFRNGNGFNFDGLVKVKSIATPADASPTTKRVKDPYSFKWLAGCVCRKHLSHKQMARQIANPRILLLACAISFDRPSETSRMASLEDLIEREKEHMVIVVDKISVLEPDVIFVEQSVSRYAQELLRDRGIAIVMNVKKQTLERVGRYTGAEVLSTVDHLHKVEAADVIGTCRTFYAEKVLITADDTVETPPSSGIDNGETPPLQRAAPSRPKTDTYLYLDGCDPLNGCTLLINGPSKKKLRILKTLMRNVLSTTYHTLLEAHVLCGLGLSFSDWYRRSLGEQHEQVAWCTTCTLRQYETVDGKLRYYQCSGSKQIGIAAYSGKDISVGNFLAKEMEALSYRCHNPKCSYTMVDHVQTFSCTTGTVTVSFEELDVPGASDSQVNVLSLLGQDTSAAGQTSGEESDPNCPTIMFGKWCAECAQMIYPFAPLKKYAYKYSLARLLEILFTRCDPHAIQADMDTNPGTNARCQHNFMKSHVLYFNVGRIVARMDFARRKPVRLLNTPSSVVIDGLRRRRSVATLATDHEKLDLIDAAATRRVSMLTALLESLENLFADKIGNVEELVLSCEDQDGVATDVLIEIALVKKLVQSEYESFTQRLAAIERKESPKKRLADTDRAKRALYYVVCSWIEEMQKLQRTIRESLDIDPVAPIAASPFSLSAFSFSTPTTQSPALSPRGDLSVSPRRPRPESKDLTLEGKDLPRAVSDATGATSGSRFATTETTGLSSPRYSKSASAIPISSPPLMSTRSETKEPTSGWKSVLWDIYRAVGKATPNDDYDLPLPAELLEGHPSLSSRSNDCIFLVNETEPITSVAYALGSQSYDDQMRSWKIALQASVPQAGPPPASEDNVELSNSAIAPDWTRLALTTTTGHMHFKHSMVDTPRHLALLYPSGAGATGSWEFSTIAFFPLQFEALRELFHGPLPEFLFSVSHVNNWAALGGKSGASFYRTLDDRFVVKHISSTEQQSFLDVLPSYFKYMSKVYYEEAPSVISKTVGMYQTTIIKKETGQRTIHHVVVMENAFFGQEVSKTFDLKGSSRNRYVKPDADGKPLAVQLDGNFVEMTEGHPMGIIAEDHELLLTAIRNDSEFLKSINIVDFSLVLGLGGDTEELPDAFTHMTVGIIDYMRQFDLMKRVESVSKSVSMIAGQSSPTIIEPALYAKRFSDAIGRYFMPVTPIDSNRNEPYLPPSVAYHI